MAKTNIKATFDTLDSYFLNTGNMKLKRDYFLDSIYTEIDVTFRNDKQMREYIKNTRKITTIIWNAFISMTNDYLENEGYTYKCTSEQLKKYLKQYGYGYEIFEPLYKEVEIIKKEITKIK